MMGDTLEPTMSREKLLPTREQGKDYQKRLDSTSDKMKIASGATVVFTAAAAVFPPALGGTVVTMTEMARQGIKLNMEVMKHHQKYPGLDKK